MTDHFASDRAGRLSDELVLGLLLRAAAFAKMVGLAEPKLAKPAKAGGARRDRTADLVIANDALSQLSYGPIAAGCC